MESTCPTLTPAMTTGARGLSPPVSSKSANKTIAPVLRKERLPTLIDRYAIAPRPARTKRPTTKSRTAERFIRSNSPECGDEIVEDQHADRSDHHRRGRRRRHPGRCRCRGVTAVGGNQAYEDAEHQRLEQTAGHIVVIVHGVLQTRH